MGGWNDGRDQELVQRATTALQADGRPEAVFATLAEGTRDFRAAALAVCVALGVPQAQAQERWAKTGEPMLSEIRPSDEASDIGVFLEYAGFFDVHPDLNERDQQARRLLEQAFAAAGGIPSGHAHGLIRKLQTGRLSEAFVSMAHRGRPTPPEYWQHLLAAADLLAVLDDDQFESCVVACRQRLKDTSP